MFYTGLHIAYVVLLCAALWLNRACGRGMLLSGSVAAVLLTELPWVWPTWIWYVEWLVIELVLMVLAIALQVRASCWVAVLSAFLSAGHIFGAIFGPSEGLGVYKITQPMFETAQLLVCIVLSDSVTKIQQRRTMRRFMKEAGHV